MAKPREYTFIAKPDAVYEAISKMLLLNAAQFDEKYTDCTDISKIDYSYGEESKVTVKVTEAIANELIKYHTAMEKRERYDVTYKLIPVGDSTKLQYSIDIVTEVSRLETNYKLMSIFYSFKQKKSFKKMCNYLETVIAEN